MSILEWWNSLTFASQIFYCLAIPSTLVLLIQTILMFLGIGEDGDTLGDDLPDSAELADDADPVELSDIDGLHIFTLRGIISFFVVFGWVGVVLQASGVGLPLTVLISFFSGFLTMVAIAYLIRSVMKLRNDGNTDNRNAIGTAGKVHLTVPAHRTGEGKVHVMLQGTYVERNAVTDESEPIPTGSEVVVVGVSGETDLVVKKK